MENFPLRFGNHISLYGLGVGGWGEEILRFEGRKKSREEMCFEFLIFRVGENSYSLIGFGF